MSTLWTIRLLGGVSIHREGFEIERLPVHKPSLLLAYLAFHLNEDISRDVLADLLWPSSEIARAKHSLAQAISTVRHRLEPADIEPRTVLASDNSCLKLNSSAATTDIYRLRVFVARARKSTDAQERLSWLQRAVDEYGGDFMPGHYDDWAVLRRAEITASYLGLINELMQCLKRAGQREEALQYAYRAVATSPECDDVQEVLLRLLVEMDRTAEAVTHYEEYRSRLKRLEVGAPGPHLARLIAPYAGRTAHSVIEPTASKVAIDQERRVPTDTTSGSPQPAALGVYAPLNQFFGRDDELAQIIGKLDTTPAGGTELISTGPARLLTITGLGGCGKTRLATEAARRLSGVGMDSLLFVSLARAENSADVFREMARLLRAGDTHGSDEQRVRSCLSQGSWIVVLDNCEQIAEASYIIQGLLEDLPSIRILATSRTPIGLPGEHILALAPLTVPRSVKATRSLFEFPSVQLYVSRAQAANSEFQLTERNAATVSAIVERLDGLPLAIELAAAHARRMTVGQILAALSDRFELLVARKPHNMRQRALRQIIDWSFQQLTEDGKRFFASLCLFHNGFTATAAEAVWPSCTERGLLDEVLDLALVSCKQQGDTMRFHLLESLRDFAAEKLSADEHHLLAQRHMEYYCRLVERTAQEMRRPELRDAALSELDLEHDNILAALETARGQPEELRITAAVWMYWEVRGYAQTCISYLERAAGSVHAASDDYAETMHGLAVFRDLLGDAGGAEAAFETSLMHTADRPDLVTAHASTLNSYALLLSSRGNTARARLLVERAIEICRAEADNRNLAACLSTQGSCVLADSELDLADTLFAEAEELFEELGDTGNVAAMLNNRGAVASRLGDRPRARAYFERALTLFRSLNWPGRIVYALHNLADIMTADGDIKRAKEMLVECIQLRNRLGELTNMAESFETLARIAAQSGNSQRALQLVAGADSLRKRLGTPMPRVRKEGFEIEIAGYRSTISEPDAKAAWLYGASLTIDELIQLAEQTRGLPDLNSE